MAVNGKKSGQEIFFFLFSQAFRGYSVFAMTTSKPQIDRAYETPFIRQFNIFMPNRVGRMSELMTLLDEAKVEVAGLSVVDSADWAVVRMVFTDAGKAREKLAAAGVAVTESDVLAVALDDTDTLSRVCKALVAAELNIQFAYPLFIRHNDCPVLAFHTDDHVLSVQVLTKRGFTLLEVMVVVVILGILAALVVPKIISRPDEARIIAAKQDIASLMQALKLYRLDNQRYPTTEQGLQALVVKPAAAPVPPNWKTGGYVERLAKDPWGNPYQYLNPGVHGEIDVFSFGADGAPGGEGNDADVGSWNL